MIEFDLNHCCDVKLLFKVLILLTKIYCFTSAVIKGDLKKHSMCRVTDVFVMVMVNYFLIPQWFKTGKRLESVDSLISIPSDLPRAFRLGVDHNYQHFFQEYNPYTRGPEGGK